MSLAIDSIQTGTEIVIYSEKANSFFKGKEVERIQVLGKERGGFVPLKVKKLEHDQAEYHIARQEALQKRIASEQAQVNPSTQFASTTDLNVNKLWDAEGTLWEGTNDKPHIVNGERVWVTFDNSTNIIDLSTDQLPGSILELVADEDYHLGLVLNDHVPRAFYYHIDVFNWLLLELKHRAQVVN